MSSVVASRLGQPSVPEKEVKSILQPGKFPIDETVASSYPQSLDTCLKYDEVVKLQTEMDRCVLNDTNPAALLSANTEAEAAPSAGLNASVQSFNDSPHIECEHSVNSLVSDQIQATEGHDKLAKHSNSESFETTNSIPIVDPSSSLRDSRNCGIIPCSLHIAELDPRVTEAELVHHFSADVSLRVVSAKIIRHKVTNLSQGYGYVCFATEEQAARALDQFNFGKILGRVIRLSYAKERSAVPRQRRNNKANLYVKNLDSSIDSQGLFQLFKSFGPITSVRVMETTAGRSKGFGFVCYEEEQDALKALELHGQIVKGKVIQVTIALNPEPNSQKPSRELPHHHHHRGGLTIPYIPPDYYMQMMPPNSPLASPTDPMSPTSTPIVYWGATYVPLVIPPEVFEKHGGDVQAAIAAGHYSIAMGYPIPTFSADVTMSVAPTAAPSVSPSTSFSPNDGQQLEPMRQTNISNISP